MTLLYCDECEVYTLNKQCPNCSQDTRSPKPPRYSPDDKYAKYRQEAKKRQGLL